MAHPWHIRGTSVILYDHRYDIQGTPSITHLSLHSLNVNNNNATRKLNNIS
jgi:hypothetical protein